MGTRRGWILAAAVVAAVRLGNAAAAEPGALFDPEVLPAQAESEWWTEEGLYNGQSGGLLTDEEDSLRWYAAAEFLLAWGKSPGDNLIGAPQFNNLYFFPDAPNSFPHQSTGEFGDMLHYGARGRFGWDNPDDSGLQLSGFYVFQRGQQRGPGRIFFGTDIFQLQPLASIPLNDGGDGEVVPFDSMFAQQYNQDVYGGDIDVYLTPLLSRPSFLLRFLFGAKFLQVREQFRVLAGDSGLGYTVNTTTNTIDYATVQDIGIPPYEMELQTAVRSRMVGPQIGLRYDLGDGLFKVWGQTRFALAASFQRTEISGQNVVNGFDAFAQQGPPFSQSDNTTRLSPVFDTSVYIDTYLFAMLPLVNQVGFLRSAQFRVGFDYLLVGELARPTNIIRYDTPIPSLLGNRTAFSLKTLSLGVNWNF
ncbi:MAG: hypothetical protein ACT4QC_11675 [Planctomycetaceae bacterium]